jgi:hypothetical protein
MRRRGASLDNPSQRLDGKRRRSNAVAAATSALVGMIAAVHRDDAESATAELGRLLTAIIDHKKAMSERPSDEPLRRVLARL